MSNESAIRRDVGAIALMFTGLGSIIGSGWLFGAAKAARLAGPDAIWAWVIGAVVVLVVAFAYAELGAMFPESGGAVRYGNYSHGSLVGFVGGWAAWIAIVSVIPVEAEASVQYMSSWPWDWAHSLYVNGDLSWAGVAISAALVVVYFLINFWGVKIFARTNSAITFVKLVVPAGTAIALIASGFHWENFKVGIHGGAHVSDLSAVLTAVATSGIIFSYNGFQSPVNLAGESRNPGRDVPFGIFGSLALATVVYLMLQMAFLGTVSPDHLQEGWAALKYSSPFAQLALALNLNWLAMMLYADAFVSPSGTGTTYTATTARMIYGMQRNGTLPAILGKVDPRSGVPRPAMWFNLAVSFVFLVKFPGWDKLAEVISVATIVTYLVGPVAVMTLRRTAPGLKRPLRVPGLQVIAPLAFVLATLMLYWARWPDTGEIMLLLVLPMPVYFYFVAKGGWAEFGRHLRAAWWLVAYLATVAFLSWIGSPQFGGLGYLPYGWDQLCVVVAALLFFIWGVRSGWRTPAVEEAEAAGP